jgi:hypothetical protein
MLERFRGLSASLLGPIARLLIKLGVSPDVVTIIGTLGVVLAALICFPQGWLWQGVLIVTLFVISDMIDGLMANITGKASNWGAFLDSTSDRLGDACLSSAASCSISCIGRTPPFGRASLSPDWYSANGPPMSRLALRVSDSCARAVWRRGRTGW